MQRGNDGGLGTQLVGDRLNINGRGVTVSRLLGEGGFSYVYLVRDISDGPPPSTQCISSSSPVDPAAASSVNVLKVTSIHSRAQRDIAEKEAKLLSRLSHPSIIKIHDACYRSAGSSLTSGIVAGVLGKEKDGNDSNKKERAQHMILMEFCEGGHALDVCNNLKAQGKQFDLPSLIIAFGQICNAVSYLHAQRPPIVHRDLKPVNFLVKNGAYKLCDFGSAVFGHVDLRTAAARSEAEDVIQKTTTQMFRAPEMVDLYMTKKLTHVTDVWALGTCLYSLAFLQNCFEEGSNLAILSRNYKIPEDNPYGEAIVELIDRMLTVDTKHRADMTEVILCLSAIYSGRSMPPRKKGGKSQKNNADAIGDPNAAAKIGTYRTDGQGIKKIKVIEPKKKPVEAKKLNPNSAAARRRRAVESGSVSPCNSPRDSKNNGQNDGRGTEFSKSLSSYTKKKHASLGALNEDDLAFSTTENPFASSKLEADEKKSDSDEGVFRSFHGSRKYSKEDVAFEKNNEFWDGRDISDKLRPEIGNPIVRNARRDESRQAEMNNKGLGEMSSKKSGLKSLFKIR